MKSRVSSKKRTQLVRHLVLCEGHTEKWYFEHQLNKQKFEVQKSKHSNAQKLVEDDAINKRKKGDWDVIYCVFDHDSISNPEEQLKAANKIINDSNRKLERVFSKPCFEIAFLFHFSKNSHIFDNNKEVEDSLNKHIQKKQSDYEYDKNKKSIMEICNHTDYKQICNNAKAVYDKLKINGNN